MSNRALRKLHGAKDDISLLASGLEIDENADEQTDLHVNIGKKKATNLFDLLNADENSDGSPKEDSEDDVGKETNVATNITASTGTKPKKKQKKKKQIQQPDEDEFDQVDYFVAATQNGEVPQIQEKILPSKKPLGLEQKYLNPDNELKRIFGSRVVQTGQKKKSRGRAYVKSSWLVVPKPNWAQIKKTGLSMVLDHAKDGHLYFKYEHNKEYRQIQFMFWEAVSSFNPGNIVAIVNNHPYHIDSLIQLSDICRMGEDSQMAAELIERALYILESAFHPSFNLTSGNCRLEYKQQENRALFLAVFKHLVCIGQRGCYRTALEFCKLLYSLDLDNDPLAVLLMMDFYAIRAQEYSWFIDFFHYYEPKKNLSQLPNFAYGIALAHFYLAKTNATSFDQADQYLQNALLMFPAVLVPLLDKCSIQADSRVLKHDYFSPKVQPNYPPSLNHLIQLYIGRSFHTWKDPDLLPWLERNANIVLDKIDGDPSMTRDYEEKRKKRYQGTPRNIYRHILLSDIKDASATLPRELADAPVMSYDPLPPVDSVSSYTRPTRNPQSNQGDSGLLSTFFRSLLPGFNLQEMNNPPNMHQHQPEMALNDRDRLNVDEPPLEGAGANLQRSVTSLFNAMRDLLSSIHINDGDQGSEDEESNGEAD